MNKVVHFEIPFDNEDRAKKFYQDAFGWQIVSVPEMNYIMATTVESDPQTMMPKTAGAINGGLMKRDSASGKSPVIVIDVQNLDEHLTKIKNAGGKVVMPKTDVGDMGIYARVADSEGNIVGVWQNKPRQ